jgi:hypothetical protein
MCPVCIATAALLAGSATSTGGLAALAMYKLLPKRIANKIPTPTHSNPPNPKKESNGYQRDRA